MSSTENLRKLHAARLNAVEELRALGEAIGSDEPTAEQTATEERLNGVITSADVDIEKGLGLIETEKRSDEFAARLADLPVIDEKRSEPSDTERFARFLRGEGRAFETNVPEARDLLAGTATDGAELLPTTLHSELLQYVEDYSSIISLCDVINTSGGETLNIPKVTTNAAGAWEGEGDAIAEADPQFATVSLSAYKYARLTQVSHELLADSAFNVVAQVSASAAEGLALGVDAGIVSGSGSSQPTGIDEETAATTFAGVAAITSDELIDVFASLPAPFRANATWLMKDSTVQYVRKLADSTGQYMWQPGLALGQPDTLLGRPVVASPDLAAMATGNVTVAFGDLAKAVKVRIAGGVRFERSDDFAFSNDLVTFKAVIRVDSKVVDSRAVKVADQA